MWTVVSGVFSKCFSECQEREHVSGISGPLVLESADLLPGVMKVKKQSLGKHSESSLGAFPRVIFSVLFFFN